MQKREREDGAAAVEFGLIVPIFALFLFGIIEFGFYFWTAEGTNSGAREVARRVVVGDCWTSGQLQLAQSHSPRATSVNVSPSPSGLGVGDLVTVTVVSDTSMTGFFPWLPISVEREYEARMEVNSPSGDDSCAP